MRLEAKKRPTPFSEISDHHATRSPAPAPSASSAWENRFASDSTCPKVILSSPNVTARPAGAVPAAQATTAGVTLTRKLDKQWTVYSEVFTTQSFQSHGQPVYTLDEAVTYLLKPGLQLDVGGNFSLNKAQPQTQIYAGLSQRF